MSKDIPVLPILRSLFKYIIYSMIMGIIIIVPSEDIQQTMGTTSIKQIVLGIVVYFFWLELVDTRCICFQALDFVKKRIQKSR